MDIKGMIRGINKTIESLTGKSATNYMRNSSYVQHNQGAFSIEEYEQLTGAEKRAYEQDVRYQYKNAPSRQDLKDEYNDFKDNFNNAMEKVGIDFEINDRNAAEFQEFVEYYDSKIESSKYRDSMQIVELFQNYLDLRTEQDFSIADYFEEYLAYEDPLPRT